ncbi:MAG: GAF domain-containing protein [Candidatus Eisenbacteria bacterium]|uniref:GAF domain-containing protein n=1 Tax=Eiseniibacteriota bacterium TaxID=2212470 RepID=A0A849SVX5_UNCEI|nr:GAF domain-containing protein [Candidatus Eisenbacteria bacterium]
MGAKQVVHSVKLLEDAWKSSRLETLVSSDPFTARRVASTETVSIAYRRLLARLNRRFDAHASGLFFFRNLAFDFIVHEGYPIDDDVIRDWRVTESEGIVGTVARTHAPFFGRVSRRRKDYRKLHPDTRYQVTVPIFEPRSRQLLAVLNLEFANRPPHITRSLLSPEFGIALGSRLVGLLRRLQHHRLAYSARQLKDSGTALGNDARLRRIAKALHALLHRDAEVAILLRRGISLQLRAAATAGLNSKQIRDNAAGLQIDLAERRSGIVLKVARTGREIYSPNVTTSEDYRPVKLSTRSQFTVPLVSGGRLVGVLLLGSPIPYGIPKLLRPLILVYAALAAQMIDGIMASETAVDQERLDAIGLRLAERRLDEISRTGRLAPGDVHLLTEVITRSRRQLERRVALLDPVSSGLHMRVRDALIHTSARRDGAPAKGSLARNHFEELASSLLKVGRNAQIGLPPRHLRTVLLSMVGIAHASAGPERLRAIQIRCDRTEGSKQERFLKLTVAVPDQSAEILDFLPPETRSFTRETVLFDSNALDELCSRYSCFLGNRPRLLPLGGYELVFLLRIVR